MKSKRKKFLSKDRKEQKTYDALEWLAAFALSCPGKRKTDDPVPISEQHPIRLMAPAFYYNASKVHVDACLDELEAKQANLLVTRFRPCTIAGRCFSHVLSRRFFEPVSGRTHPVRLDRRHGEGVSFGTAEGCARRFQYRRRQSLDL